MKVTEHGCAGRDELAPGTARCFEVGGVTRSPSCAAATTSTPSVTPAATPTCRSPRARCSATSGRSSAGSTAARSRWSTASRRRCPPRSPCRCTRSRLDGDDVRGGGAVTTLEIRGLRAAVGGKEILQGIDLTVSSGEVHAVMGPNGAGKSTLSAVVMGRPGYEVLAGTVTLDGDDLLALPAVGAGGSRPVPGDAVPHRGARRRPRRRAGGGAGDPWSRGRRPRSSPRVRSRPDRVRRPVPPPAAQRRPVRRREEAQRDAAARRAAPRRSPSSTSSTPASTSTRCGPAPAGWRIPPRRPTSACWPSPTTAGCCTSCEPDRIHILVKGRIVASGGPELADVLERDGYAAFVPDEPAPALRRGAVSRPADPFADPLCRSARDDGADGRGTDRRRRDGLAVGLGHHAPRRRGAGSAGRAAPGPGDLGPSHAGPAGLRSPRRPRATASR